MAEGSSKNSYSPFIITCLSLALGLQVFDDDLGALRMVDIIPGSQGLALALRLFLRRLLRCNVLDLAEESD